jgi:hypothetical protein
MDVLKEFGEFLWAVATNWAGYTTGGLVVALLWLWSTLRQVPISRKIGTIVAIAFLVLAFFNAWRDKYHDALKTQAKIDELSKPELQGRVDAVGAAPSGAHGENAVVAITASITNTGAPSIADITGVTITPKSGGQPIPGNFLPKGNITLQGSGQSALSLSPADHLPTKAFAQPIARGGGVGGYLMVVVHGITKDQVLGGSTVVLNFNDVNGKQYSAQFVAITPSPIELPDMNELEQQTQTQTGKNPK